jgi:hypothetical protein
MMNPKEIVDIGISAATEQLKNRGWSNIIAGDQVPSPVDIIAVHNNKRMLVSVTPTILPKEPEDMANVLKDQIISMARENNADAYQAKVVLNQDMRSIEKMSWKKL